MMNMTEILNFIDQSPDGCTINDILDSLGIPKEKRETARKNYATKLSKLARQGYIVPSHHGVRNNPTIWRAA